MNKASPLSEKVKISLIEDSDIHREWLKAELANDLLFEVVSEDRFGRQGIASVKEKNSDIVLLDFQLEDLTGLEAAKRISAYNDKIKIFIMTAHSEISIIERIIRDKNIQGIAIKGSIYFSMNLKSAIKIVSHGGVYMEPSLLEKLRGSDKLNGISNLTPREFEVFIQSHAGKQDEKIAEDLCVELPYIKNIKSKIHKKIKNTSVDTLLNKLIENANPKQALEEMYL